MTCGTRPQGAICSEVRTPVGWDGNPLDNRSADPFDCVSGGFELNVDGSIEGLLAGMRSAVSQALIPMQTDGTVSRDSLNALVDVTEELVRALKGQRFVDREVLREIYFAERVLRAEAKNLPDNELRDVTASADRMQLLFGLLLLDESPDDRRPGVPRVV